MASKALSDSDKLQNWWTGRSYEVLCLADQAWFASAVRTPINVPDVGIGNGQFLHTFYVAVSPATVPSSLPLAILYSYGQGIGV